MAPVPGPNSDRAGEIRNNIGNMPASEFWTNIINARVAGDTLTSEPVGIWNAGGASSVQQIDAGDGFVELATNETNLSKMAGLSHNDNDQIDGRIEYAIHLRGDGAVEIVEQDVSQGYFGSYEPTDTFRVEVFNNQVRYRRNGAVFHTSLTRPTYPLALDAILLNTDATIARARIVSCVAGDTSCMPPEMWKNVRYARAVGNTLTSEPVGLWNAGGASSVQQIDAGDGFVEFATNETNLTKIAGLGHNDDDQVDWRIEYAIQLRGDGTVQIVEQDVSQGYFGSYQPTDTFRVEVFDNQVRYRRNGAVFHTSLTRPTYPLALHASLVDTDATITRARIVSCVAGDTSCMPPEMWKNVRYARVDGDMLTREPGDFWNPGGASSVQQIDAGNGFVEFATNETNLAKIAGLRHNDDQDYWNIEYAIYLGEHGVFQIVEQGSFQGEPRNYEPTDTFRVEILDNKVRYLRNNVVFQISNTPPTYPLALNTSLLGIGATIVRARIMSCATKHCMLPSIWKNVRYASTNGDTLTRALGGSWNAGASSLQQIEEGNGFVEFATNETTLSKVVGLGHSDDNASLGDIEYGIALRGDGTFQIYEQGMLKYEPGTYQTTDVFRIEVLDRRVHYRKNGHIFYTSTTPPTYPLELDTSLLDMGATIVARSVVSTGLEHCPISSSDSPFIVTWEELYRNNGITLCRGVGYNEIPRAYVQIVDFKSGARMRVMSEPLSEASSASGCADTRFRKYTAPLWYMAALEVADPPWPTLFSATNATFFKVSDDPTLLSYPEKVADDIVSCGFENQDTNKYVLGFSDPSEADRQQVFLDNWGWPNHVNDEFEVNDRLRSYFDAIVSPSPDLEIFGRHTYIGTRSVADLRRSSQDRVYILTTTEVSTSAYAKHILASDFHTQREIQLDGGGSTQFYSAKANVSLLSDDCPQQCRPVPNVLLVYEASEP